MHFILNDLMPINMPIMVSRIHLFTRVELHFRTDWYPIKTWNIWHAQFVLLFTYHSWWSKMGEKSFFVWCAPLLGLLTGTCKIMYHHNNSCKLLAVSNVLLRTQNLSGITRCSESELPLSFSSELFLDMIHKEPFPPNCASSCTSCRRQFC